MAKIYLPYTGVGSREISKKEYTILYRIAEYLSKLGFTLRSGKAAGSDTAFELGCHVESSHDAPEIFIPWKAFKGGSDLLGYEIVLPSSLDDQTKEIIVDVHPAPDKLSQGALKLHQRNVL